MAIASFCLHAQRRAERDLALCPGLRVPPQPGELLLHQGCTGHAELCSRATSDPSELIFIYNVSWDLRAQVRKWGNLLLGTLSRKNTSRDETFHTILTTRRDEQMGTKSRGLFSMWANPFEHLHSPAIK